MSRSSTRTRSTNPAQADKTPLRNPEHVASKEPSTSKTANKSSAGASAPKTAMKTVNDSLAALEKALKEKKSTSTRTLLPTYAAASQSLDTLRRASSSQASQQCSIEKAASALCGLLVDLRMFPQAKKELCMLSVRLRALWSDPAIQPGALGDDLVSHLAFPLPQDTSVLSSEVVLLFVTTQFQLVATLLRSASTKSDWKRLAQDAQQALNAQGNPLRYRAFLSDYLESANQEDPNGQRALARVDGYLSSIFSLVLKCATGIDSSSSSTTYDADSMLLLRLYALRCALEPPNLSAPATSQEVAQERRDAFWDQFRRVVGLYIRSVTVFKFSTSLSLQDQVRPLVDLAAHKHPDLCQGDLYDALLSQLRHHSATFESSDLAAPLAQLRLTSPADEATQVKVQEEPDGARGEPAAPAMLEMAAALDKWRKAKEPASFPSSAPCLAALERCHAADEAIKKLINAATKALSVAENRKSSSAISTLDTLAAALITSVQRMTPPASEAAQIPQYPDLVDLLVQLARHHITSVPTKADNLLEQALPLVANRTPSPNEGDTELQVFSFHAARVLSSASYNCGGIAQRSSGKPDGLSTRFFRRACELGQAALRAFPEDPAAEDLRTHMANRWGVLAHAFLQTQDRKASYHASLQALKSGMAKLTALDDLASHQDLKKRDSVTGNVIVACTRISVLDLLQEPSVTSLRPLYAGQINDKALGAVLELQVYALERSSHKPESKSAVLHLIDDLLDIYSSEGLPLRRARTLLWRLRHTDTPSSADILRDAMADILALLAPPASPREAELESTRFGLQTQANLLYALHLYRAPTSSTSDDIAICNKVAQATEAALEALARIPASSGEGENQTLTPLSIKESPQRKRNSRAATYSSSRASRRPVTSKPSSQVPSTPAKTTPVCSNQDQQPKLAAADDDLCSLLRDTAGLLAVLGLDFLRLRLLQKAVTLHSEPDTIAWFVSELAASLAMIGQSEQAEKIVDRTLHPSRSHGLEDFVVATLLLRKSLCLAHRQHFTEAASVYDKAFSISQHHQDGRPHVDKYCQHLQQVASATTALSIIFQRTGALHQACHTAIHGLHAVNRSLSLVWKRQMAAAPPSSASEDIFNASYQNSSDSLPASRTFCQNNAAALLVRYAMLDRVLELQVHCGSGKLAAAYADQLVQFAATLHSPLLHAQALLRRTALSILTNDVASAAADLDQAQTGPDEERDVVVVRMRCLLGMLAAKLGLRLEAHAHFVAAQAKLGVFSELFRDVLEPWDGAGKTSPLFPNLREELKYHQHQLSVSDESINTKNLEIYDNESVVWNHMLAAQALQRSVRIACERNPVYSLIAESVLAIPSICPVATRREDASHHRIWNELSRAASHVGAAFEKGHAIFAWHTLRHLYDLAINLRLLQEALGVPPSGQTASPIRLHGLLVDGTYRRELLQAARMKLGPPPVDVHKWPQSHDEDASQDNHKDMMLRSWSQLAGRDRANHLTGDSFRFPKDWPESWITITISLLAEEDCLCISRQSLASGPYIIRLPMDRLAQRENEDCVLNFEAASAELSDIVGAANSTSQRAKHVETEGDKAAWWNERRQLDQRLKGLLENMDLRWLGAFKAFLKPPTAWKSDALEDFIFAITRAINEGLLHKKDRTQYVALDKDILRMFAELAPDASPEDFEDMLHFIAESLQFAGIPVVFDEVDIDQIATDLRMCLERLHDNQNKSQDEQDARHIFLILSKDMICFPWESLPSLQGQSISRIPSLDFLSVMAEVLPHWNTSSSQASPPQLHNFSFSLEKASYILNPGADLPRTQASFEAYLQERPHWQGIVGRTPMSLEFESSLKNNDLFLYFGHGGGESYVRSDTLRRLARCAVTFLWGCSSGRMKTLGEFDPYGTPWNYMMAGCPSLVANLWDVTDKDIDKFTKMTFSLIGLNTPADEPNAPGKNTMSIPQAVGSSRDSCLLRYLNGAAPVVYGIPARIQQSCGR